jgi:RHS repeat-associated protein
MHSDESDDRAGTVYRYLYNDRGRLQQFRIDNQVHANYRYDFFERINWRQTLNMTPAGATHYIQDLQGQLTVEATDSGTMLREYIWLDDMPLAVFADLDTASPQLYYVHPDHLNRPLRMTDSTQAVVWDAVYRPFGEAHSITGSATLNLRFPGQYFLIESGLAYNWHRHYDPSLGRYTQPDPIADHASQAPTESVFPSVPNATPASFPMMPRDNAVPLSFQDGPSLYSYVKSNPQQLVDREGLAAQLCILSPAICATVVRKAVEMCITVGAGVIAQMARSDDRDRKAECDHMYYEVDTPTCNAVTRRRGRAAGRRCHDSAAARYSACLRGDQIPPLNVWNN